jgi:lipase chaperone LimK
MKYIYTVDLAKMEEVYFSNTQTNFFADEEERTKFNAQLVIEADTEQESTRMRMGMTDINMWQLLRTEE